MTVIYQLASNQQDIWHDQNAFPDSPVYNIGGTLIIKGDVNYKALNQAIQHLINENDVFRLSISQHPPLTQVISKNKPFELEFIDFSQHPLPEEASEDWLSTRFKKPFTNKDDQPLWHFALIKESHKRHYLLTKYHHIIADGWSTTIVIARLAELYNARLKGQSIEKKSLPHYFDFIKKEQDYLKSTAFTADQKYWEKALPSPPTSLIARRYPASPNALLPKAHLHTLTISRDCYNAINQLSTHYKCTSYHTFLTTIAIYFSRIYQRDDIIIGVPSLNRSGARYKDVFGMFISLSPLCLKTPHTESFEQLIQHCHSQLRELYRHHRFPLGKISKRLQLLKNGRDTLFDIILSYEKHHYSALYGTARITAKQQFSGVARYPLAVTICEFSDTDDVDIIFEGAENCFTAQDVESLADHIHLMLQQILSQPTVVIKELNLLTNSDKYIVFEKFNQKNSPSAPLTSVLNQFYTQAKNHPLKIAVEYNDIQITYQQLDKKSTQLAQYIISLNNNTSNIIALLLTRRIEMIIGILAILKAGSGYLPIPVDIPNARINSILEQSKATILLSESQFQEHLSACSQRIIYLDNFDEKTLVSPLPLNPPNLIAYVIFTSGSTGIPKGVLIDHNALSTRLAWLQSLFKITPADRMAQSIAYNFDPSIIEIFLSLTQGACLVLTPEDAYTNDKFAQFIISKKITSLAMLPSSIRMLLAGLKENHKTNLRVACCGGERLDVELSNQFLAKTDVKLFNVYGPTETTIIASAWQCLSNFKDKTLPIGRPADHTSIYIVDQYLNILPSNVLGEIAITGITLATGYINQPEISSNSFPTLPYNQSRLYKTGDIGYIDPTGILHFSGRVDRQVKISGYRIELAEIESILLQHDDVNLAAVLVNTKQQATLLYAYVETKSQHSASLIMELSLLVRQNLPNYMQPQSIIPLKHIAITPLGKIDYLSLPEPNVNTLSKSQQKPRNKLEYQLHTLWIKSLSTKTLGIHDNFFELGGDSLSAITLMIAIETLTGTRYPLSFLLENPSIADQASAINQSLPADNELPLLTLSEHKNSTSLYIAASGTGDFLRFSDFANALGSSYSVYMLQPDTSKDHKQSIHAIATQYAALISQHCNAPYSIAGFSIGGITALETARLLSQNNQPPLGVILLDSIYPRWPLQSPLLLQCIKSIVKRLYLNKITINNRRLGAMLNDPGIRVQLDALPRHVIRTANVPVDLILTKGMWMFHPLLFSSWKKMFLTNLTTHTVSGLHGKMFSSPHLSNLTLIVHKIFSSKSP